MPMTYTDDLQRRVILRKAELLLAAVAESMGDNDEALDTHERKPDEVDFRGDVIGWSFTAPASLDFYRSSGTGTPMLDGLVQALLDSQAAEWARQFPQRASLPDCATEEGEFQEEAHEWEDAALEGEVVYAEVEVTLDGEEVTLRSCFMNEINVPYGLQYRETIHRDQFAALDGDDLEALCTRLAEAPYQSLIVKQNSGGRWHAWFGTADGRVAFHAVGGYETEEAARTAVEREMRA